MTAALALARQGQSVLVLEGAPSFDAIGFGIQFGPNVFHVFDRIGVSDAVLERADSPSAVLMMDGLTGEEVTRVPTGPSLRARFKYPYIVIHRIDLHDVLLDACRRDPLITLEADAMVTGFVDNGGGVAVTIKDGRSFEGAALVGADGFDSKKHWECLALHPESKDPVFKQCIKTFLFIYWHYILAFLNENRLRSRSNT